MNKEEPMVVACIDGSKYSAAVCDYASWASQRIQAPLKLLHNIELRDAAVPGDLSGAIGLGSQEDLLNQLADLEQQYSRLELEKGRRMLEAAKERAHNAGVDEPVLRQRHGNLAETLIECEADIRLLVLGVRGEEHEDNAKRLGNHLEVVARSLHRPILAVNRDFSAPQRIMLAYDGSEGARKALDMITLSDLFMGLPCHIAYVGPEDSANTLLEEAANKLESVGREVVTARLTGKAGEALCQYQSEQGIDLTLMGAFSHTRLRDMFLGSFTAQMLLAARQPLLLLR